MDGGEYVQIRRVQRVLAVNGAECFAERTHLITALDELGDLTEHGLDVARKWLQFRLNLVDALSQLLH